MFARAVDGVPHLDDDPEGKISLTMGTGTRHMNRKLFEVGLVIGLLVGAFALRGSWTGLVPFGGASFIVGYWGCLFDQWWRNRRMENNGRLET